MSIVTPQWILTLLQLLFLVTLPSNKYSDTVSHWFHISHHTFCMLQVYSLASPMHLLRTLFWYLACMSTVSRVLDLLLHTAQPTLHRQDVLLLQFSSSSPSSNLLLDSISFRNECKTPSVKSATAPAQLARRQSLSWWASTYQSILCSFVAVGRYQWPMPCLGTGFQGFWLQDILVWR